MAYMFNGTEQMPPVGGLILVFAVVVALFFVVFVATQIQRGIGIAIGVIIIPVLLFLIIVSGQRLWWCDVIIAAFGVTAFSLAVMSDGAKAGKDFLPTVVARYTKLMLLFLALAVGMYFVEGAVYRSHLGEEISSREVEVEKMDVSELMSELVDGNIDLEKCEFIYTEREDAEVEKITNSVTRMNNNYFHPKEDTLSEETKYTIEVPLEAEKYLSALK